MARRSRARKRERAIAIACGDSPDVFVAMERAYLSENGHDLITISLSRTHVEGRWVAYSYGPYRPQAQQRAQLTRHSLFCRVEVGRITAGLNRRRRYKHMEMQAREAGRRGCSRRRSIRLVSIRVRGPVAAAACVPAMGGFGFEVAVGDEAAE